MLQNSRVTAFTVLELLRGNQLGEVKLPPPPSPTQIRVKRYVNTGLKATKIIGQRKAFYRQRIPEFSPARKETVDIDIVVTPRNGDRKIMQSIRITSRPHSRKRIKYIAKYYIL